MTKKERPRAEVVRILLDYNQETGVFIWKTRHGTDLETKQWNIRYAGKITGLKTTKGYLQISIYGVRYLSSHLAWLYVHGRWPENQIDHKNGDRANNSIENLRETNQTGNNQNLGVKPNNNSGVTGVYWHKQSSKWSVRIGVSGKNVYIGLFNTLEEATVARENAKRVHHKFEPDQIVRISKAPSRLRQSGPQ